MNEYDELLEQTGIFIKWCSEHRLRVSINTPYGEISNVEKWDEWGIDRES